MAAGGRPSSELAITILLLLMYSAREKLTIVKTCVPMQSLWHAGAPAIRMGSCFLAQLVHASKMVLGSSSVFNPSAVARRDLVRQKVASSRNAYSTRIRSAS